MEFEGTKGEWKLGNHFSYVVTNERTERPTYSDEDYKSEKKYYGGYLVCESISKKADAKLIAEAPNLLEQLIEVTTSLRRWESWSKGTAMEKVFDHEASQCEAAINKALKN